jgi:hypothetical protein
VTTTLPYTPSKILVLQRDIENVLKIPPDFEVNSGVRVLWINTINDLMRIMQSGDLLLPFFHPTFDRNGEQLTVNTVLHPCNIDSIEHLQQ